MENNNKDMAVPVKRIVESLDLVNEDVVPEVKVYLMKNKTNSNCFKLQVAVGLHDIMGNLDRKRFSVTLPEDIKAIKQAKMQADIIGKRLEEEINDRFSQLSHHLLIPSMEKFIAEKRGIIRDTSVDNYEYRFEIIKRYCKGKNYTVEQITPAEVDKFVIWALKEGRYDGNGGLARRSVVDAHGLLHLFFKEQVKSGIIDKNPCELSNIPKDKNNVDTKEIMWLDVNDYSQLLSWFEENGKYKYKKLIDMLKLCIIYGLRKEEILALKWDVIKWGNEPSFEIRRTRTQSKKIYDLENVKSRASHREYPITEDVMEILKRIKDKQEKDEVSTEYIFSWQKDDVNRPRQSKAGDPYRPDYIGKLWKKAMIEYSEYVGKDWTGLTFHKLRHSCASILIDNDWGLEEVQDWLGHEDSEVTRKIYIHKKDRWKYEKSKSLDSILKKRVAT